MKPHAWTLWVTMVLVGTAGAWLVSRGLAEETHQVKSKPDEVTKNDDIDKDDEEVVAPESVTKVGETITIVSKTFTPPGTMTFKKFPGTATRVDIETDPDSLSPSRDKDKLTEIKISVAQVPETAGSWPLKGEGNLQPPSGGEGYTPHWSAKMARQIKMYVAYARYCAERADDQDVQVPDGWTVTITLADGTNGGTTIKTKEVLATKLPKKIECTKEGQAPLIVDFVYSDDEGAWDKFLQAWERDYHIILYSGHANSGQYFDIGPNVGKTEEDAHKGEPKNGYVVLKETVAQTPVALYVGLACYPEIPYMMLDSACVRIKNKYPNVNAIGHRKTSLQSKGNIEIADVIEAVLAGGLEVLPDLEAEDIGIDDEVTEAVRDARRALFTQNGASAIWHNIGKRDGYDSAWRDNWHAYTERQLIEGAQGQPQQDGEFDDVQEIAKGAETEDSDTVIISTGNNTYLETVKDGDDVYDNAQNPTEILAGENKIADTTTTGAIGVLDGDARQFWLRFQVVTEGSDLSWFDMTLLWLALEFDARSGLTTLFQNLVRSARE